MQFITLIHFPVQTAFYALTLLAATFLWGYLFYKRDYHPQPLRVILEIFTIGLFAMIPVFGYKAIYQNFLPKLAEYEVFTPLFQNTLIVGFAYFTMNLIMLALLLFVLSGLVSVVLTVFEQETVLNIRRALREESLDFVAASVMIGLLIYAEAVAEKVFDIELIQTVLGAVLFLGVIEEYIKHLIVRFVDDKKLKDIDDAITLSVMVGLAFALIETVVYAFQVGDFGILMYRSLLTLPIHLVASGIFGYFYGLAHFSGKVLEARVDDPIGTGWLVKGLKLKKTVVYREQKMTEGLFAAALFHALANVLFDMGLAFVVVPLVVLGLATLAHLYNTSHEDWRLIRRRT